MSFTEKRLCNPTQLTTSGQTLYTVPASKTAIVKQIVVTNVTGSAATFSLYIGSAATPNALFSATSVAANDAIVINLSQVLNSTEILTALASANSTLNITISGVENDGPLNPLSTYIADGAITNAKLADSSVTSNKLAATAGAVMVFANSTARSTAISSPTEGMLTYLQDVDKYQFFNGSAWVDTSMVPTGTVVLWSGSSIPNGWLPCYGQMLLRTDYPQLFLAIGTTYGKGDNTNLRFVLPSPNGRRDHCRSEWFCFDGLVTVRYSTVFPNTTIYQRNSAGTVSVVTTTGSTPTTGTFTSTANVVYYGDNPVFFYATDAHQTIVPWTLRGRLFGLYFNRLTPQTIRWTSLEGSNIVRVWDGVTGGISGTATTTVTGSAWSSATYQSPNASAAVIAQTWRTSVGQESPEVMMVSYGTGGDREVMKPLGSIAHSRYAGYAYTMLNAAPTVNQDNVAFDNTDCPVMAWTIGDGAGSDCAQAISELHTSNRYVYGDVLSDYMVSSQFPNTRIDVSYWNGSAWVVWDTHFLHGGRRYPDKQFRDGTNGSGVAGAQQSGGAANMASGATLWKWEGNYPFAVAVNDSEDDEMFLLGWMEPTDVPDPLGSTWIIKV